MYSIATAMKQSTRILMTFVGSAIGGFVGLCFTFALGMAACGSVNSSGFLSEDQCKQGWGAFAYLAFIAGLVGGGIWGYKVLGGKAANWVIGSEEQTVSKNLPAGINIGDTKVACLSCGASMDVDGLFCGSCGAPKQEADTSDSDGTTYEPKVTLTTPSPSDKIKRWPRLLWVIPILWFTGVVGSNIGLWLAGVFLLLSLCLVIPSLSNKLIPFAIFGILVILIVLFTFCYVSDLVEGLQSMMNIENFQGPVNLGNPTEYTILNLAKKIIHLTGSKSKIGYIGDWLLGRKICRLFSSLFSKRNNYLCRYVEGK